MKQRFIFSGISIVFCSAFLLYMILPNYLTSEPLAVPPLQATTHPNIPKDHIKKRQPAKASPVSTMSASENRDTISDTDDMAVIDHNEVQSNVVVIETQKDYEQYSKFQKLPDCLANTQIIGKLEADEHGQLIVSRDIRVLFEYFLSAINEEGIDKVKERIEEYIRLTLPYTAQDQAFDILDSYLEYRRGLKQFDAQRYTNIDSTNMIQALKEAVSERMQARREFLSEDVVKAFFEREETYDQFTLSRLELEQDKSLTESEKLQKISELEGKLPQEMRDRRQRWYEKRALEQKIKELQSKPGNEEQIYNLRAQFYGKAVATRLRDMDRQELQFKQKYNEYLELKHKIIFSDSLSDNEKKQELEQIEQDYFSENEIHKVRFLEKVSENQRRFSGM